VDLDRADATLSALVESTLDSTGPDRLARVLSSQRIRRACPGLEMSPVVFWRNESWAGLNVVLWCVIHVLAQWLATRLYLHTYFPPSRARRKSARQGVPTKLESRSPGPMNFAVALLSRACGVCPIQSYLPIALLSPLNSTIDSASLPNRPLFRGASCGNGIWQRLLKLSSRRSSVLASV
jgi:hypothetical protein